MTMIALVFKILVIIMMMMMTIVVTGKKDNHKDDNTRKRQKYNDDDRKRKIFKNSWPRKIVWVLGWTLRLLNQAIYKACHVTSILYVARIIIANVLCISVSLRFCCCLFFSLSLLGEESPIFWIWDSLHIDWHKKMNLMSHSILNANFLFVPLFVWMIDISIWAIATYPSPNPTTVNW